MLTQRVLTSPRRALAVLIGLTLLGVGGWFGWRQLGAWNHYRQAEEALERRDFLEAADHLNACLQVWPRSAATHFLAARAARRANHLDEAAEHLAACELLGGPVEAIVLEEYLIGAQRGELADVEKKLLACISQDHPDTPLILDVLTWQLKEEHRLQEALTYLDLWIERRPNEREAHIRRGWVREHLMDVEGAIDAYRDALAADPERDRIEKDRVRLRLGQLLVQKNRGRQAVRHFEIMSERQPRNPDVILGLARCYLQLNRQEKARKLLDDLLADQPDNGQALGERGRLALDLGHIDEAESRLQRAARLCPDNGAILYNLAKCLEAAGKPDAAKKVTSRLETLRSDERRMSGLMAEVMKSPRDADLLCEVGNIFLHNGMPEDGTRWLKTALAQDPWHRAAHQALADYYASSGQPDRAAPHREALRALQQRGPFQPAAPSKK
jgi:tetratricopeptide (TPR) repeat protein